MKRNVVDEREEDGGGKKSRRVEERRHGDIRNKSFKIILGDT